MKPVTCAIVVEIPGWWLRLQAFACRHRLTMLYRVMRDRPYFRQRPYHYFFEVDEQGRHQLYTKEQLQDHAAA
jgi:hypothetical protein